MTASANFKKGDDGSVYADDPRPEVALLTPFGSRVLDVGCSRGAFGAELKRLQPSRKVFGIEPTSACEFAVARLDGVVQGCYPEDMPLTWTDFDVICFNDVLEHLIDPWTVLADSLRFLSVSGSVIASIPNIRFIDVIVDLVFHGNWRYQENGVLDRTHLRFFTRNSIRALFMEAGFTVDLMQPIHVDASHGRLAKLVRYLHLDQVFQDFLAQRYVIVGTLSR